MIYFLGFITALLMFLLMLWVVTLDDRIKDLEKRSVEDKGDGE